MRGRRLLVLLVCLAALTTAGGPAYGRDAPTLTRSGLAQRIDARLRRARLQRGRYGVVVLTRTARPLVVYTHDADRPLVPASAAKVLTSATALDVLGPSHRFVTRLTARGRLHKDGVFEGDLVLHGNADPNLSGRFFDGDPTQVLKRFASAVARYGIRAVDGALVLDDGALDREYVHPDWPAADRARWYGAPVGGLSFNDGCVDVNVEGGRPGAPADVRIPSTTGPWKLVNRIKTVAAGTTAVGGRWVDEGRTLQLHGRIRANKRASFHVPVPDPGAFLGGALLQTLERRGIRVRRGQRLALRASDAEPGALVAEHESEMPRTLGVLNRNSQNVYASLVFKACGAALEGRGTWASGGRAVRTMLERRRIGDDGTTVMRDGSGLSPKNRISAGVLANVLASFDRDVLRGPILLESLPVSGKTGTLRRRLRDRGVVGRVHAKTGTLNDTRARTLAGYVDGHRGRPGYVFAILLNGRGASHAVIDDVVRELAR